MLLINVIISPDNNNYGYNSSFITCHREQIAKKKLTFEQNSMNIKRVNAIEVKIFIQMLI